MINHIDMDQLQWLAGVCQDTQAKDKYKKEFFELCVKLVPELIQENAEFLLNEEMYYAYMDGHKKTIVD